MRNFIIFASIAFVFGIAAVISIFHTKKIRMSESKLIKTHEIIAQNVTNNFQKVQEQVMNPFKKIEDKVVGTYQKIENSFVSRFLTREGESVEEAKNRLAKEQAALKNP